MIRRMMIRITTLVDSRPWLMFFIAVALIVPTALWVEYHNQHLATLAAPMKVVSLELARSQESAICVVDSWRGDVLHHARWSIYADFAFIFAYTFALLFLIAFANTARNRSPLDPKDPLKAKWQVSPRLATNMMITALTPGCFDLVENASMLWFISDHHVSRLWFFIPAVAKFLLVVALFVYFVVVMGVKLSNLLIHVRHFLKASRLYAPGLIAVLISYFVFIRLTQGQDVIIQVSEYTGPKIWSIFCLLFWTYTSWYSARLVGYVKMQQPGNLVPPKYHWHFPRLIAHNGLASIQAAVLALPTLTAFTPGQLWLFVILQNAVYGFWDGFLSEKNAGTKILYGGIAGVIGAGYALLLVFAPYTPGQGWLLFLAGILFGVQLGLIYWWKARSRGFYRTEISLDPCATPPVLTMALMIGKWRVIPVDASIHKNEQNFFNFFNVLATAGLIVYVGGFSSLGLADRMGPLAFTLLAFGILIGLSNIITIFSIYRRTNFFFVLFLVAVVLGFVYDPFKVRLITCEQTTQARPDLATYFDNWTKQRETLMDRFKEYPVYLVIADGGASRSGYWVSSVLSELQDESIRRHDEDPSGHPTIFSDHLFCLAGASGGSVGNATFYALLRNRVAGADSAHQKYTPTYRKQSKSFLKQDFLTPVLTHWLGSDLVQHLLPLPFTDRAGVLERAMENFSQDSLYGSFGRPYHGVVDQSGKLPVFFINTTSVHSGTPAVVSSLKVSNFSRRVDVLKEVQQQNQGELAYSTAVVLGARFPYVSPAGRIGNNYFVDGGYFDNTGAGIVHEMMQKVDSIVKTRIAARKDTALIKKFPEYSRIDTALYQKLRFRVIYLSNTSPVVDPPGSIHPLANDLAAPILTVLGTYSSQTDVNNRRLGNFFRMLNPKDSMYTVNLYTSSKEISYPMNWVISDYNLNRMDARLEETKGKELEGILRMDSLVRRE